MALELVNKLPYDHPYRWDGTLFGGPKLWRPDELGADLALWLDAEDTASITLNGSNVSQWSDKSGNNRHATQGLAADQPAYTTGALDGKPVLTFANLGDGFTLASGVGVPRDIFVVSRGYGYLFSANTDTERLLYLPNSSTLFWNTASGSPSNTIVPGRDHTTYHAEGYHATNSSYEVVIDGASALSGSISAWDNDNEFTQIGLQWGTATGVPLWTGEIAEIVWTDAALPVSEREKVEGYLAWKWGLEANLPGTHPYRYTPPTTDEPAWDADALSYIGRVQDADVQALELNVRIAINDFVVGCKADGIWDAINASCILAGARTLFGALVPLKGTAPTNFGFVPGDYNRKTGLLGNGSTKYLDSNRNNNADPQNSKHLALYQSSLATADSLLFATSNLSGRSALISFVATGITQRINSNTAASNNGNSVGFVGGVRTTSTATAARVRGADFPDTITSQVPSNENIGVFATASGAAPTNARLAFYSVGESLDLALLDTRVTALINAYGAIP